MKKSVLVLGAGFAGLELCTMLSEEFSDGIDVTLIDKGDAFTFVFSTLDVNTTAANDPLEALIAIQDLKEQTIIVLRDFHLFLQDPNPILIRKFKDVLQEAKTKSKTLIILGCRMILPPELEREITLIEFALPGKAALGQVLDGIVESAKLSPLA